MTSPSENTENTDSNSLLPGMPDRLSKSISGRNNVTRLEFHAMSGSRIDPIAEAAAEPSLSAIEVPAQEQIAELEQQLKLQEQRIAAQIEAAEHTARAESLLEWDEKLEEQVAMERARISRACAEIEKERTRYFAEVEVEVVKLALAIAARVLHREANIDPLFLTAAVRVVLEKVADKSTIELHVPVVEVDRWQSVISMEADARVQLVGDERLEAGECILETNVGRVELGVKAQLEEIEKGFFDLLQQRPV